jgi:hypothetical protein
MRWGSRSAGGGRTELRERTLLPEHRERTLRPEHRERTLRPEHRELRPEYCERTLRSNIASGRYARTSRADATPRTSRSAEVTHESNYFTNRTLL